MLAAFLPPYPFRGAHAPYLWCYYRLLEQWQHESAFFITGQDYVRPVSEWQGRWECEPDSQQRLDYRLPEQAQPSQHHYAWLDETRFDDWLQAEQGNPLAVFSHFLTQRDADFEQELRTLFSQAPKPISGLVTFCNVPTLSAVCAELNIPLLHLELGPLRGHLYRDTRYVDFNGVNGNTESGDRYSAFRQAMVPDWHCELAAADVLDFFMRDDTLASACADEQLQLASAARRQTPAVASENGAPSPVYLGVALQVEDDSNLIAFANGMNSRSLLTSAEHSAKLHQEAVLVRPHPGSVFSLRPEVFKIDGSASSLEFVARCQRIFTINSSVALEAILLNKPVRTFGDSSLNFILASDEHNERLARLIFYVFGYLVPARLQMLPDYLRFRLSKPSESAIIQYHLGEYMTECTSTLPDMSEAPLSEQISVSVLLSNQANAYEAKLAALAVKHQQTLQQLKAEQQQLHAEQQQALVEQQQLLAQVQHALAVLQELHVEQQESLAEQRQLSAEQQQQLNLQAESFAQCQAELQQCQHAYEQDQQAWLQEKTALLESSSWRLTQPLRTARAWFRGKN